MRYYDSSGYATDESQNNYQPLGEVAGDGSEGKGVENPSIPLSSKKVSDASKELDGGSKAVTVDSRTQAEELFLGKYQGNGYTNVTGMDAMDTKNLFEDKANTIIGMIKWVLMDFY